MVRNYGVMASSRRRSNRLSATWPTTSAPGIRVRRIARPDHDLRASGIANFNTLLRKRCRKALPGRTVTIDEVGALTAFPVTRVPRA